MDLSIVIVSWNVKEKLKECLRSIEETVGLPPPLNPPLGQGGKIGLEYEVFVVDNASKDGTVEMVEKEFPWVHVIANDFNAGFAKANNQAIRLSQGQYVLLLNPDMRVFPWTLEGMVKFMDESRNSKVGVAGCHLVQERSHPPLIPPSRKATWSPRDFTSGRGGKLRESPSGKARLAVPGEENWTISPPFEGGVRGGLVTVPHVRRFPRLADQFAIMLKVPHLFPKVLDAYMMKDFDYSKEAWVDSIRGSFFMIRREVLDKIGLLDEGFFIWFEEVDFCKRAIAAGFEVAYTPLVKAVDYVGQSFKQMKLYPKQKMFTHSMVYYFKKHRPWWEAELLDWIRPVALAAVWVGDKLKIKGKRMT